MEPKFKTSFIPKQSLAQAAMPQKRFARPSSTHGVFFVVSFVIFLVSLVGAGGVFFYTKYLESSITSKQESLARAREAFEPDTIKVLARVDKRIEAAKLILEEHIAPSVLFALLEQTTLKSVRFDSFTYTNTTSGVSLDLKGEAKDFSGLALQSDVFGSNQALRNPVVHEFDFNEKRTVSFGISAGVDPAFVGFHPPGVVTDVPGVLAAPELEMNTGAPESAVESATVSPSAQSSSPSSAPTTKAPAGSSGTKTQTPAKTSTPPATTKTSIPPTEGGDGPSVLPPPMAPPSI